jgi:hypothetical protein
VSDNDDHDRVMRIITARCGDALTDADLATLTQHAGAPAEPDLPLEIGEQILNVLAEMGDRLERMVGVNGENDDATERR